MFETPRTWRYAWDEPERWEGSEEWHAFHVFPLRWMLGVALTSRLPLQLPVLILE